MECKYFYNGEVLTFGFELDENYEVGTTYEDSLDGAWVPLNKEQEEFYNAHPSASVREIFDCALTPPYEPTLGDMKNRKVGEISAYDRSEDVNQFSLGGKQMWLDKDTRVGLANSISIEQAAGKETTILWYDAVKYVIPIPLALQMLAALELYALASYNATQEHVAAVMLLETKEEVEAYDYTAGYPDKLVFNL